METGVELVTLDGPVGEVDLEAFGKRLLARVDQRADTTIAQLRQGSNTELSELRRFRASLSRAESRS